MSNITFVCLLAMWVFILIAQLIHHLSINMHYEIDDTLDILAKSCYIVGILIGVVGVIIGFFI